MGSKLPVAYILIEQLQEAYLCTFCTCSHLPDSTGLACFGAWSGLQLCPVYGTVLVTALVWLQLWPGTALSGLRSVRVTARSGLQLGPGYSSVRLQLGPGYRSVRVTAISVLWQFRCYKAPRPEGAVYGRQQCRTVHLLHCLRSCRLCVC